MKHTQFIAELVEKNKIRLTEQNDTIAESYAQKAINSLRATNLLIENNLPEEATTMAYYAMYHKVTALFYTTGIICENHAASITILKELFSIDNKKISFAQEERVAKQYYTDSKVTTKEVKELRETANEFIAEINDYTDKLTNDQKNKLKQTFKQKYYQ